jgi:glycosyltransferase involved in cell wall biosynthesis
MKVPETSRPVLSIVAPFYNEEETAKLFYTVLRDELGSLDNIDFQFVFVDDGSDDQTLKTLTEIAQADTAVQVLSLSRNFGHQVALTAGLDHASGDAVLMMDSDLQHPPALIPRMIDAWRDGSDVVSAVREQTSGASFFKRHSASLFYRLVGSLTDTPITPGACDFCLLSRRAHQALMRMPERHRFLRGMISWIGFPRSFLPFNAPARAAGETKYTVRKMVRLALDAVFSFSTAPIKLASQAGGVLVLAAAIYFGYILWRYWIVGDLIPGWGSLICTVLILNGVQLFFTGLIGEYLSRTFEEAKRRPIYLIKFDSKGVT